MTLKQYKWKNRLILSYPRDQSAWAEQQKRQKLLTAEIKDRDLIIIRVDAQAGSEPALSKAERLAMIKKYQLTLGSHVLIGKDGFSKKKQLGPLELKPLFTLIDQMSMRQAEMKSRAEE